MNYSLFYTQRKIFVELQAVIIFIMYYFILYVLLNLYRVYLKLIIAEYFFYIFEINCFFSNFFYFIPNKS